LIKKEYDCNSCGKCEELVFQHPLELAYVDDVLEQMGWTKRHGNRYCNHCSQLGTVR
jgi:hypothetical protein